MKEFAEDRAKKYEDLSNTLQETLNILDNIQKPQQSNEEDKAKLEEAERKIAELIAISNQKDLAIITTSE